MRKYLLCLFFVLALGSCFAQEDDIRFDNLKSRLLIVNSSGLNEIIKTDIQANGISLSTYLIAISKVHNINLNVSPALEQMRINQSFKNVTVTDVLLFLCKEYQLTIDITGSILSIKPYEEPIVEKDKSTLEVSYQPNNKLISLDLKDAILHDVFKQITEETGHNLVFSPGLENRNLNSFIKNTSFEVAMEQLAFANNLRVEKSTNGFYTFQENFSNENGFAPTNNNLISRNQSSNYSLNFKIVSKEEQLLDVDFVDVNLADLILNISSALDIDVFTASPLDVGELINIKAKNISFEELLTFIFESQDDMSNSIDSSMDSLPTNMQNVESNTNFSKLTFKRHGDLYFFGNESQLSLNEIAVVQLQHRSVELLSSATSRGNRSNRSSQSNFNTNTRANNSSSFDAITLNNRNTASTNENFNLGFSNESEKPGTLVSILPKTITKGLDIQVDNELNQFYVNGSSNRVKRFQSFIKEIDKPVPLVLIEVMFIETNHSSTIEAGVGWGIGKTASTTEGSLFPSTDITIGATTINKILGGFKSIGTLNLGKVTPNFFATIKAMENNGFLTIRSTPKLSTLNGHRANFSNGETSYYEVTQRNIYGTDNPQTSELTNYQPINAELGLTIKPLVSGDGQVTLDIFVVQSSFGKRITESAPPDISSREFSSIIRVKDQDIVILGGLEERIKNNSGSGVPLLSKIPIIKWFFSKRVRKAEKTKLTVLIKPTVIL